MNKVFCSFSLFMVITLSSLAQKRYWDEQCFNVRITHDVFYGENKNFLGTSIQKLYMDIYEPKDDTLAERPLIILAHGGGFIGLLDKRNVWSIDQLCKRFAGMGYVTATIDYREGFFPDISNPVKAAREAVVRAVHDMKAAVRFFRKDAARNNVYKINPNLIIIGGESAGAITAIHTAYMDNLDELTKLGVDLSPLGGLDGNSGNPGYSSDVNIVITLCGAINDTSWIEKGEQPMVAMHGDEDATVPFAHDNAFAIIPLYGSSCMAERMKNLGIDYAFYNFKGQDHVPFHIARDSVLYMDTTVAFIKAFLYPYASQGVVPFDENKEIKLFPNPAGSGFSVAVSKELKDEVIIELFDNSGNCIYKNSYQPYISQDYIASEFYIPASGLPFGVYLVRVVSGDYIRSEKVVIRNY